jgi:hypothetical protein
MNDMHENEGRLPTWLVAVLLTIILLALGVQTAFAGFCWAG